MVQPENNDALDDESLPRQQNLPLSWGTDAEGPPAAAPPSGRLPGAAPGKSPAPAESAPASPGDAEDAAPPGSPPAPTPRPEPPETAEKERADSADEQVPSGNDDAEAPAAEETATVYRLRETDIPCEELLRDARRRTGLTEDQAAARANVPKTFLTTLEAGRFEDLPEPHYVKTYVTRLCRIYNLDATIILARVSEAVRRSDQDRSAPAPGRFQLAPNEDGVSGKVVYRPPSAITDDEFRGRFWIRLFVGLALAAVLLLAVLGFGLQWLRRQQPPGQNTPRPGKTATDVERPHVVDLDRYMPPQQLPLKEIPVP